MTGEPDIKLDLFIINDVFSPQFFLYLVLSTGKQGPNGSPQMVTKFLQKMSGCRGPGAIIQRVQSVIFHLGNYTSDIFIIKLREDPRNG